MRILIVIFALTHGLSLSAQSLWHSIAPEQLKENVYDQRIFAEKFELYELELDQLRAIANRAPERFKETESNTIIQIPNPDGDLVDYVIFEAPVMPKDLARKYPTIRTYAGYQVGMPSVKIRMDITTKGFHAMVRSSSFPTYFVDPYDFSADKYYMVYYKSDFITDKQVNCLNEMLEYNEPTESGLYMRAGDCKLRQYRLALACTGEYATYHGGTVASVLSAFNTTMNRVNGVFEADAGITMQLVSNTSSLIFLNANSDPYSNNDGVAMLGENQVECDNTIGSANYDIGHVFSTGGGGVAYLEAPCDSGIKAGGVTGSGAPVGDPYDVDYVAHEMGHQFGGTHTQNNNCNRSSGSAMEPGSASTIMGYAGICSPNIQNNSDDYFHTKSIEQMGSFVTGIGNACATTINTSNSAPVLAVISDKTVPISTPFVLSAAATDPGSDPITYCWEQYDKEVGSMPPSSTNTQGPMFRSYTPTSSGDRHFPTLSAVLNGTSPTWEVLPSITRDMDFVVTARDLNAAYGCTDQEFMTVSTSSSSGPFIVTSQSSTVTYAGGSSQNVTWNVASTNAAPVSCSQVDILFSTDGGTTFTTVLDNTANDGSESIIVPNVATTEARIMVRAEGNVFYNVNSSDFTVTATPLPVNWVSFQVNKTADCHVIDLQWEVTDEYNNDYFEVQYSLNDGKEWQSDQRIKGELLSATLQTYTSSIVIQSHWANDVLIRIAQVDIDGTVSYSPTKVVTSPCGKSKLDQQVTIFPNPVQNELIVQHDINAPLYYSLSTISGQSMDNGVIYNQRLDTKWLEAGVYILRLQHDGHSAWHRIVKW